MSIGETLRDQALAGVAALATQQDALATLRAAGRDALAQLPFPDRKTERWKYTSVAPLQDGYLSQLAGDADTVSIPNFAATQLVIRNGVLPDALPDIPGITLARLDHIDDTPDSVFAGFNAAALKAGLSISVAANTRVEDTLHLVYLGSSAANASYATRTEVTLGDNSRLTLVEHFLGEGPVLGSARTRINVGANAELRHYRLQSEAADTLHIGELEIIQQRDSRVKGFQLMRGNVLRRNDVRVWMQGEGADLVLRGVFIARDNSHIDNHVCIEHATPHCTSDQIFKGIAGETARAVFNGRIHIYPGACKTDAQLSNRNLLLSNSAEIDSKPELEIYNDDVKCGHGTTVGQMDHQQLFYLQSRGIGYEDAKRMLGVGFINELLLDIPDQAIAEWARDWLGAAL